MLLWAYNAHHCCVCLLDTCQQPWVVADTVLHETCRRRRAGVSTEAARVPEDWLVIAVYLFVIGRIDCRLPGFSPLVVVVWLPVWKLSETDGQPKGENKVLSADRHSISSTLQPRPQQARLCNVWRRHCAFSYRNFAKVYYTQYESQLYTCCIFMFVILWGLSCYCNSFVSIFILSYQLDEH